MEWTKGKVLEAVICSLLFNMALKPLAHLVGSSETDYNTKTESIIDCRVNGSVKT